jgi:hypothetical protein
VGGHGQGYGTVAAGMHPAMACVFPARLAVSDRAVKRWFNQMQ